MTVDELRKALERLPSDMPVVLSSFLGFEEVSAAGPTPFRFYDRHEGWKSAGVEDSAATSSLAFVIS